MSAFIRLMDYVQERLPQLVVGLLPLNVNDRYARAEAVKQVGELMWRIDHLPKTGLEQSGVNPAGTGTTKKQFEIAANKMSERHTIELREHLEKMVADAEAGGWIPHPVPGRDHVEPTSPIYHLTGQVNSFDPVTGEAITEELGFPPMGQEAPIGDLVDMLLQDTPLENANWGAW